jgi:excisionase family DNA binding protein
MHAQGTAMPAEQGTDRIAYTVAEVAALLGKHSNTIYGWVRSGALPSERIGNTIYIPKWALARLISPAPPVCQNDSATLEISDDTLKAIARELVSIVRRNTTVDWDKKEQVRASLRRHIRRLLTKYKYPPDKQESAVLLVIQQAELIAAERAA